MKRLLISSIIFSVLILSTGACAPVTAVTSEPIETPSPPTTSTPPPPSLTPTDLPPPETTRTPIVSNGIQDLKPENIVVDKPNNYVAIVSDEAGDPAKTPIVRGSTYAYIRVDYDNGNFTEWLIMPIILRNSKTIVSTSTPTNGTIPADLFKTCTANNPKDCTINSEDLDRYKAWFKQQFCGNDPNCSVVIGLMTGASDIPITWLKGWETNRVLYLRRDNTFGGGGDYVDPLVDKYYAANSKKFTSFTSSADILALDGAVVETIITAP